MLQYKDGNAVELKRFTRGQGRQPLRSIGISGATIGLILSFATPVAGQQAANAPQMDITVREETEESPTVRLFLNRSAVIDSNVPISRVQSFDSEIAIVESIAPKQVLVTGKSVGSTHVMLSGEDGQKRTVQINVEIEMLKLRDAISRVAPSAKVDIMPVDNTVILTGSVPSGEVAQRMVDVASVFSSNVSNHMKVAGEQQILLRCTIAEVSKKAIRQLGVNGFFGGDDFRDFFLVNQLDGINPINIGAAADQNLTQQLVFLTGEDGIPISSATTLSLGFPRVEMQLFMQALRENQLLRVLAEPNLVAMSGQSASFLAGGEFPIPVPQTTGSGTTITIEYKEFGIRLTFAPTLMGGQVIRMSVEPEVSSLDFSSQVQIAGTIVPGLTTRRAQTTVEIGNGQSLVMAGLMSEELLGVARRIPGLGDVPVLGALFSSNEYRKNLTELVIVVTPEIVAPLNPDQVPPLPGDEITEPNDWQLFALGLVAGEPDPMAFDPVKALKNDVPVRATPAMLMMQSSNDLSLHGPWGQTDTEESGK
jgi:pilus assembly protein CpaC